MTPKIIELKQAPVVLVEMSERPVEVKDIYANGFIYKDKTGYIESEYLEDYCDWEDSKLVGILSALTEEQFAECVDKVFFSSGSIYKNYKTLMGLGKASEAFDTLLESEKVYMDNPYEHLKEGMTFAEECENKWQEAQSRTIDPARTVVLIKKDG